MQCVKCGNKLKDVKCPKCGFDHQIEGIQFLSVPEEKAIKLQEAFVIKGTVLVRYNGNSTLVTIPDSVTSIGEEAFKDNFTLEQVHLPYGLRRIDAHAFEGCRKLKSVVIPGTVQTLSWDAFWYCSSLKTVEFQDGIQSVAFSVSGCYRLRKIDIPDSVVDFSVSGIGPYLPVWVNASAKWIDENQQVLQKSSKLIPFVRPQGQMPRLKPLDFRNSPYFWDLVFGYADDLWFIYLLNAWPIVPVVFYAFFCMLTPNSKMEYIFAILSILIIASGTWGVRFPGSIMETLGHVVHLFNIFPLAGVSGFALTFLSTFIGNIPLLILGIVSGIFGHVFLKSNDYNVLLQQVKPYQSSLWGSRISSITGLLAIAVIVYIVFVTM